MTVFNGCVATMGCVGLFLTGWLVLSLRRESIIPRRLLDDVPDLVRRGHSAQALEICRSRPSSLGKVWTAALTYAGRAGHPVPVLLDEVMYSEVQHQAAVIHSRATYLLDVSSGALVAGLFAGICGVTSHLAPAGFDALRASPEALHGAIFATVTAVGIGLCVSMIAQAAYVVYQTTGAPALDELGAKSRELLAVLVSSGASPASSI